MENINIVLANNIQNLRKKAEMTQDELAARLGVTFQAVSKWENERSAPDISLLPEIADIFGCSIDELFSRKPNYNIQSNEDSSSSCITLDWQDDGVIRGVVFEGRNIIHNTDDLSSFTFTVNGDAKNISSDCNISLTGNVNGKCSSEGDMYICGDVSSSSNAACNAGGDITITGDVKGACCAGKDVNVVGDVAGYCYAGNNCLISGDVASYCNAENDCIISGNVNGLCCAGRDVVTSSHSSENDK